MAELFALEDFIGGGEALEGEEAETSFNENPLEQRQIATEDGQRARREHFQMRDSEARQRELENYLRRKEEYVSDIRTRDQAIRNFQERNVLNTPYDEYAERFRNNETLKDFKNRRDYKEESARKQYEEEGYEPEEIDQLVNNYKEIRDLINHYGFSTEEYETMLNFFPEEIPDELTEELKELEEKLIRNTGFEEETANKLENIDSFIDIENKKEALLEQYGYTPEEYEKEKTFFPKDIPKDLTKELERLENLEKERVKNLQLQEENTGIDETVPKSIEAELNPNLRPKRVTFEDINQEGFRSNFRRQRDFSDTRSTRTRGSSFRTDATPKGGVRNALGNNAVEDLFYTDYAASKTGQGLDQIFSEIKNIYGTRRDKIEISRHGKQVDRNRRVLGIVLKGENRDELIKTNRLPAYYSTANIRRLLRNGIMPFGWNEEMAVQQGFGDDISKVNFKEKTKDQSHEFLQRETTKAHLKATEGDLKNLRNRLKSRKLIQYYSQF